MHVALDKNGSIVKKEFSPITLRYANMIEDISGAVDVANIMGDNPSNSDIISSCDTIFKRKMKSIRGEAFANFGISLFIIAVGIFSLFTSLHFTIPLVMVLIGVYSFYIAWELVSEKMHRALLQWDCVTSILIDGIKDDTLLEIASIAGIDKTHIAALLSERDIVALNKFNHISKRTNETSE